MKGPDVSLALCVILFNEFFCIRLAVHYYKYMLKHSNTYLNVYIMDCSHTEHRVSVQ